MKWNEIRHKYPTQWLKLKILKSHEAGDKEYINEGIFNALVEKMEVISAVHFIFELKSGVRVEG